ncbi:cupin domain-containing protein [Alkaliphilus serpentinus]|uniref:Cupin domain-containing protein n=1 Tax=Alkaliphilus serpentinus TaxID=1482731 RepID=A0A833MDM1_9FIRM|nr:cupin domain-containing protein [Alkaliphilus serpentinus]KAB3529171.1 cupin domain-containing protein [Alkaliphilus serpentinus]
MIKRKNELKVVTQKEFLGGKGTLQLTHFLEREDAYDSGRLFALSVLTPGSSIGYHTHTGDGETYFILKGRALVNDDGEEAVLEAGDVLITKNGSSHSIENIGDTDLEYIALILFDK